VERCTTCPHKTCRITLEAWHVPSGFRVYRSLAVLKATVGEVMKMEQVLHLGLMQAWAPVCAGGEERFV